jgi:ornithine cyclodeaminase/alanine dehydrogenase-like protein (mu-crystallin family)
MLGTELTSYTKRSTAFAKGRIEVLTLSEEDIKETLDLGQLLDVLADGFKALSRGDVVNPDRPQLDIPGAGYSLAMSAWMPGMHLTVKIVNIFEGNIEKNVPSHLATINLFAPETGLPVCVMDGTYITAVRTSGSAILSVRALARKDAKIATVVGAGVQGNQHLTLLPLVRDFSELRIVSKHLADAENLARQHPRARAFADIEEAVRGSDVVCLATHAYEPVIDADWVRPGTHVSSVGVAPPKGEFPAELVHKGRLYVESKDAFAPFPVGCAELAGLSAESGAELGDMLLGRTAGRVSDDQITIYKGMGIAMEDMVAADLALRSARRLGKGTMISL